MSKAKPKRAGSRARQGVQSIEVGGRLLQALVRRPQAQMLRDLAAAAQMPPAKAHRYLVSLARMGLIEQQEESGLYELGPFALELGLAALGGLDAVAAAAPRLTALRQEIGQTVALAVWANRGPTIVRWLGPDAPVAASLRVGSVLPLTRSATGRVFLSWLPREETAGELRRELEQQEEGEAASRPAGEPVERIITEVRRRGYAHTSEFIPGISGIAAPVFDHAGALALALVALGYTRPFEADLKRIARHVIDAAAALSARLGHRGELHPQTAARAPV